MKRAKLLVGTTSKSQRLQKQVQPLLAKHFDLVEEKPQFLVIVGGDGTLLHYLRDLDYPEIPVLGIDGGSLGYFQELSASELPEVAAQLKTGRYRLQKFPLLELRQNRQVVAYAFNEFAVERASARAAHLSLSLDGHKFEKFIGDGLIISTPQGSTAYSGAAGGAILPHDLDVFEVVPSNPHQSALYKALRQPLVLSSKARAHFEVLSKDQRPVRVVADGHQVEVGSSFDIGISRKYIRMIRTQKFNFYERLSQKLIG